MMGRLVGSTILALLALVNVGGCIGAATTGRTLAAILTGVVAVVLIYSVFAVLRLRSVTGSKEGSV